MVWTGTAWHFICAGCLRVGSETWDSVHSGAPSKNTSIRPRCSTLSPEDLVLVHRAAGGFGRPT
eukprot:4649320-Amphidinium_carterae.1